MRALMSWRIVFERNLVRRHTYKVGRARPREEEFQLQAAEAPFGFQRTGTRQDYEAP
jgi:hypothetical protein